jgi:hypothetical protein
VSSEIRANFDNDNIDLRLKTEVDTSAKKKKARGDARRLHDRRFQRAVWPYPAIAK